MGRALVAYGVVLVVLLMLVRRAEAAGWTGVGALDVAAAFVDALLVLAMAAGVLLAGRLGLERWARSMRAWHRQQALEAAAASWTDAEVIGVTSWRPGTRPLTAAPAAAASVPAPGPVPSPAPTAGFTYVGPSYGHGTPPVPPFHDGPARRI